jgi:hypothetical protein
MPAAQTVKEPAPPVNPSEDLTRRHDERVAANRTPLLNNVRYGQVEFLEICKTIHDRDRGCITPAEEFITDLVGDYGYRGGITPELVEDRLKRFRDDFTDAVDVARRFAKAHPDLIEEQEPAA